MINVLKLSTPLDTMEFPDGSVQRAVALDAEGWALFRQLQKTPDNEGGLRLLRRCFPDATDENIGSLGFEDVPKLILYCARQIVIAEQIVGESSGEATGSSSSDSPTSTTSTPSSPG
jgi:hypothetical protein